jgi:hypothetical protein
MPPIGPPSRIRQIPKVFDDAFDVLSIDPSYNDSSMSISTSTRDQAIVTGNNALPRQPILPRVRDSRGVEAP